MISNYDAILIVSFGGPESPEEVMPFLENVLRGRDVPRQRMMEVAEHYHHFGGVSPINAQNRQLISALIKELESIGPQLPVYWGNRNWNPLLSNTLQQMADDGVKRAMAFFTSSFSSYSGCRQYHQDIALARRQVGPAAPEVDKLRAYYNHPGFIEPMIQQTQAAIEKIPAERRDRLKILFTAHSIPLEMAKTCDYVKQLNEACRLVAEQLGRDDWRLVYQSRSGPPNQPWLEPDVLGTLEELSSSGDVEDVVVVPIGFVSDHLEVLYDLDFEAQQKCQEVGLNMIRAATVGTHPRFVRMIQELIVERSVENPQRLALGEFGPGHDICPVDCCQYTPRRPQSKND